MAAPRIQESTWLRACSHLSAEVLGETVILHGSQAAYFGLNSTGSLLWRQLKEPALCRQLVRMVAERFGLKPEVVTGDVHQVLEEMLEAGLIEIVSPAPTA